MDVSKKKIKGGLGVRGYNHSHSMDQNILKYAFVFAC